VKGVPGFALAFYLLVGFPFAGIGREEIADAESQEKVIQLLQGILQRWNGINPSNRFTVAGMVYTNAEAVFRDASRLMPGRLDLRFGLASALVGQASQTNGFWLATKMNDALQAYRNIETRDRKGFEAPVLRAAYARALGDTNEYETSISRLLPMHPERTREYVERFALTDQILQMTPDDTARETMPGDKSHAIVIFGAALETNGTIKVKLISRLQQGYKLAKLYPKAPIIVSGGNQKGGVTEAYIMSQWFLRKGVSSKRLFLEDQARDTVGNALYSAIILKKLGITHVTLVTSYSHIRRALVVLEEACRQRGLNLQFDALAANSSADPPIDPQEERLGTFRDLMRASGIWAYPGLQR
jgi:vancomycin permeability regulator SanA